MIDWMELMRRKQPVHALLAVDATDACRAIRSHRASTGEPLSFTAFIVASLAKAVAEDKRMQAYRIGRGRLITFEEVDVAVMVERELEKCRQVRVSQAQVIRPDRRVDENTPRGLISAVGSERAIRPSELSRAPGTLPFNQGFKTHRVDGQCRSRESLGTAQRSPGWTPR